VQAKPLDAESFLGTNSAYERIISGLSVIRAQSPGWPRFANLLE
jgi:hypothetical protein